MEILKAILLGFLQGVTEFLPISSSGHLSVFQHFFGNVGGTSSLLFTVLLHMGTLIAVFVVYYKTIWGLIVEFFSTIKDIFTGKFKWSEMNENRRMLFMFVISCVPLLFLLIPVGGDRRIMDVLGGLADDNDILVEGVCFLFTAALLLIGSWRAKKVKARPQIGAKSALAVGVAQAFAAGFPGISRSGSTISTGMICGVSKEYMVRYSFILGIPAILAANVMEIKDAVALGEQIDILPVIIGVVTAEEGRGKVGYSLSYQLRVGVVVVAYNTIGYCGRQKALDGSQYGYGNSWRYKLLDCLPCHLRHMGVGKLT